MEKRGGNKSTTWPKGKRPPVQKPKGSKHKRTILKESMGLKKWEGLKEFIETEGADKLVIEMKKLKGRSYVQAYGIVAEYVKPKLSRVQAEISKSINISDLPIVFE